MNARIAAIELVASRRGGVRAFAPAQYGKTYTSRVLSVQDTTVELTVAGVRLRATSQFPFYPGDLLTVRLLSGQGRTTRLQLLERVTADPLIERTVSEMGLRAVSGAAPVISALLRGGYRVSEARVRRTALRLSDEQARSTGDEDRSTRGAVESEMRGLPGAVSMAALFWPGRFRGDGDRGRRTDTEEPWERDTGTILTRTTATPDHSLQLFNALSTDGETHWVVIPIREMGRGSPTEGAVRVGLDTGTGMTRFVVIDVTNGLGAWWMRVDQVRRRIIWGSTCRNPSLVDAFGRGLESIFLSYDTEKSEFYRFDGADVVGRERTARGVDRFG